MKADLSIKERKFIDAYLETGNISESAKRAGSKGKDVFSLYTTGKRWLDNVGITIKELHEIGGITDQYLREKLREGLTAKKKYFGSWQGDIIESKPFEDVPTRLKALEIAHKLRGEFIDRTEITGKDSGDLVLQIKPAEGKKKKRTISIE